MQGTRIRVGALRRWHTAAWAAVLVLAVGTAPSAQGAGTGAPVSSRLVALQKSSGALLATHSLWRSPDGAAGKPAVAGGWAYFVEEGKTLCGVNLATGKVVWRTPLAMTTRMAPVAVGAMVLAFDAETLSAFTATTGRPLWNHSTREMGEEWQMGEGTRTVLASGRLFLCSARALLAMDIKSGQPIWAMRRSHAEDPAPVVSGRFLYVRDGNDPNAWGRYMVEDGSDARDEVVHGPLKPKLAAQGKQETGSRILVSPDRRSMTVQVGNRRVTYRAPEPFTIAGVVGETASVVCVQLVAHSPGTPGKG